MGLHHIRFYRDNPLLHTHTHTHLCYMKQEKTHPRRNKKKTTLTHSHLWKLTYGILYLSGFKSRWLGEIIFKKGVAWWLKKNNVFESANSGVRAVHERRSLCWRKISRKGKNSKRRPLSSNIFVYTYWAHFEV